MTLEMPGIIYWAEIVPYRKEPKWDTEAQLADTGLNVFEL